LVSTLAVTTTRSPGACPQVSSLLPVKIAMQVTTGNIKRSFWDSNIGPGTIGEYRKPSFYQVSFCRRIVNRYLEAQSVSSEKTIFRCRIFQIRRPVCHRYRPYQPPAPVDPKHFGFLLQPTLHPFPTDWFPTRVESIRWPSTGCF